MLATEEKILIVLDTSAIITALFSPRENYETYLLQLGQQAKLTFVFSEKTFKELQNTLQKAYLKSSIPQHKIAKFMAWYKYNGQVFKIDNHIKAISRDKNDDIYLELTVISNSKYLISVDKDLLVLKSYQGVLIMNAKEFLEKESSLI